MSYLIDTDILAVHLKTAEGLMSLVRALLVIVGVLIPFVGHTEEPDPDQTRAIANIEKIGGVITYLDNGLGKKSIALKFQGPKNLKTCLSNLKAIPDLVELHLNWTKMTDDDLRQLAELNQLKVLELAGAKITDEGLEQLKELTEIQELSLVDTSTAEIGIKNIRFMKKLRSIDLLTFF